MCLENIFFMNPIYGCHPPNKHNLLDLRIILLRVFIYKLYLSESLFFDALCSPCSFLATPDETWRIGIKNFPNKEKAIGKGNKYTLY